MNEFETQSDPAPDATVNALRDEVQSLRAVIGIALFILILLSGSLNFLLCLQSRVVVAQAAETRRMVGEFDAKFKPAAIDLWGKLLDYSRTHPDFAPVIEKYRPYMAAPAPAAAAPVKK